MNRPNIYNGAIAHFKYFSNTYAHTRLQPERSGKQSHKFVQKAFRENMLCHSQQRTDRKRFTRENTAPRPTARISYDLQHGNNDAIFISMALLCHRTAASTRRRMQSSAVKAIRRSMYGRPPTLNPCNFEQFGVCQTCPHLAQQ
jgi:hypothetical protein